MGCCDVYEADVSDQSATGHGDRTTSHIHACIIALKSINEACIVLTIHSLLLTQFLSANSPSTFIIVSIAIPFVPRLR